jgi:NADH dehydrogenase (ubiquinone) 1 alpha subcomplex subunit 5
MAFRVSRVLMAYAKKTTGIVGLDVQPNARQILIDLYNRILDELTVSAAIG